MRLRGILDTSLGGFTCIRGYASLGDIEKISKPDFAYQRNLNKNHKKKIVDFLERGEYLFFPELILGYEVKMGLDDVLSYNSVEDLLKNRSYKSKDDGISIKVRKQSYKSDSYDVRAGGDIVRIATIDISEEDEPQLIRIDGNHRLNAVADCPESHDKKTPFCIILFDDQEQHRAFSNVIFHNINSKAEPLTPEETLKGILDNENFSDYALKTDPSFGWEYFFARKLVRKLENVSLDNLSKVLGKRERTVSLELFKFLLDKKIIPKRIRLKKSYTRTTSPKVFSAIRRINTIYGDSQLRSNTSIGMFVAFVYFSLLDRKKSTKKLVQFDKWVKKSHLAKLKEVKTESIVEIFENILISRQRQIFVSMQFCAKSKPTYKAIKECINKINLTHKLDIKIRQIRMDTFNKGYSYVVTDEILELIESSGLLIADLSDGNKNVYHEIGYLMGLNQGQGLDHENFILIAKNQTGLSKKIGFNLRAYNHVRFDDPIDLLDKLTVMIEQCYDLPTLVVSKTED